MCKPRTVEDYQNSTRGRLLEIPVTTTINHCLYNFVYYYTQGTVQKKRFG